MGQANAPDVDVWKILKCAGGIATVVLSTIFVVGKSVKVVKAVQAGRRCVNSVGGPRAAARLLAGASTPAEKERVLASARATAGASVADFFGINQIQEGCF